MRSRPPRWPATSAAARSPTFAQLPDPRRRRGRWHALGAVLAVAVCAVLVGAWFQKASPFTHTPEAPFEAVTAAPLLIIGVIVVLLLAGGLAGFRRRDLASSA